MFWAWIVKTKFKVGDEVKCKDVVCTVLAVQAYWWGGDELISYKLEGVKGWIYEHFLDVVI